jgi:hypothetical protein
LGSFPSGFHRLFATRPVSSETNQQFGGQVLTMVLLGTRGPWASSSPCFGFGILPRPSDRLRLKNKNLTGAFHTDMVECTSSVGREFKTEIQG